MQSFHVLRLHGRMSGCENDSPPSAHRLSREGGKPLRQARLMFEGTVVGLSIHLGGESTAPTSEFV